MDLHGPRRTAVPPRAPPNAALDGRRRLKQGAVHRHLYCQTPRYNAFLGEAATDVIAHTLRRQRRQCFGNLPTSIMIIMVRDNRESYFENGKWTVRDARQVKGGRIFCLSTWSV